MLSSPLALQSSCRSVGLCPQVQGTSLGGGNTRTPITRTPRQRQVSLRIIYYLRGAPSAHAFGPRHSRASSHRRITQGLGSGAAVPRPVSRQARSWATRFYYCPSVGPKGICNTESVRRKQVRFRGKMQHTGSSGNQPREWPLSRCRLWTLAQKAGKYGKSQ